MQTDVVDDVISAHIGMRYTRSMHTIDIRVVYFIYRRSTSGNTFQHLETLMSPRLRVVIMTLM